jgi:hypothetical protein
MGSAKHSMCALEDSCRYLGVALAALALLTACNGGAGSSVATSTNPPSTPPAQAAVLTASNGGPLTGSARH